MSKSKAEIMLGNTDEYVGIKVAGRKGVVWILREEFIDLLREAKRLGYMEEANAKT